MSDYLPFGNGPWPCLNPATNHYKQLIISNINIKRCLRKKKTLGEFNCACGYQYSRYGPDKDTEDLYKEDITNARGAIWEEKLRNLIQEGNSLQSIAILLKTQPYTVQKYSHRLDLTVTWKRIDCERRKMSDEEKMIKYKQLFSNYLKENPRMKRSELLREYNKQYQWLLNNDKDWLDTTFPKRNPNSSKISNSHIDWVKRDEEILSQVTLIANRLFERKGRPIRVSIAELEREIGKRDFLYKHLDKLPKVKEYLDGVIESIEDYQLRKIKWASSYLLSNFINVSHSVLIKTSGVYTTSELVIKEIEKLSLAKN